MNHSKYLAHNPGSCCPLVAHEGAPQTLGKAAEWDPGIPVDFLPISVLSHSAQYQAPVPSVSLSAHLPLAIRFLLNGMCCLPHQVAPLLISGLFSTSHHGLGTRLWLMKQLLAQG